MNHVGDMVVILIQVFGVSNPAYSFSLAALHFFLKTVKITLHFRTFLQPLSYYHYVS